MSSATLSLGVIWSRVMSSWRKTETGVQVSFWWCSRPNFRMRKKVRHPPFTASNSSSKFAPSPKPLWTRRSRVTPAIEKNGSHLCVANHLQSHSCSLLCHRKIYLSCKNQYCKFDPCHGLEMVLTIWATAGQTGLPVDSNQGGTIQ